MLGRKNGPDDDGDPSHEAPPEKLLPTNVGIPATVAISSM